MAISRKTNLRILAIVAATTGACGANSVSSTYGREPLLDASVSDSSLPSSRDAGLCRLETTRCEISTTNSVAMLGTQTSFSRTLNGMSFRVSIGRAQTVFPSRTTVEVQTSFVPAVSISSFDHRNSVPFASADGQTILDYSLISANPDRVQLGFSRSRLDLGFGESFPFECLNLTYVSNHGPHKRVDFSDERGQFYAPVLLLSNAVTSMDFYGRSVLFGVTEFSSDRIMFEVISDLLVLNRDGSVYLNGRHLPALTSSIDSSNDSVNFFGVRFVFGDTLTLCR